MAAEVTADLAAMAVGEGGDADAAPAPLRPPRTDAAPPVATRGGRAGSAATMTSSMLLDGDDTGLQHTLAPADQEDGAFFDSLACVSA